MRNIFVTGGAGFLGSHIAKYHREKGDRVWVVDDLSSGKAENLDGEFFRVDFADLRKYPRLSEALKWADWVYHMAATVGQKRVLADPLRTLSNSIGCCQALLEKATPRNRLLIASSAGVYWYGVVGEQILKEDAILKVPSGKAQQQVYGVSKLVCELLAQSSSHHCVMVRLFNIFGPDQRGDQGYVIPRWIEQCTKNEPITIFGSGHQMRSFCYVDDAVRAMAQLLENSSSKGEIYNVGNQRLVSLIDLAELIKQVTRSCSTSLYVPYQTAYGCAFEEAENILPSFEKIEQHIGFRAEYSLEEGLAKICNI